MKISLYGIMIYITDETEVKQEYYVNKKLWLKKVLICEAFLRIVNLLYLLSKAFVSC